jgi:hypothetical protein
MIYSFSILITMNPLKLYAHEQNFIHSGLSSMLLQLLNKPFCGLFITVYHSNTETSTPELCN